MVASLKLCILTKRKNHYLIDMSRKIEFYRIRLQKFTKPVETLSYFRGSASSGNCWMIHRKKKREIGPKKQAFKPGNIKKGPGDNK